MKKTIFNKIQTLEDIQKRKLRLEKKIRTTEESIAEKATIGKLLFADNGSTNSFFDGNINGQELIKYFLPLGLEYLQKKIHNNPDKKLIKRVLIYTLLGSISALIVNHYLVNKRKTDLSENQ